MSALGIFTDVSSEFKKFCHEQLRYTDSNELVKIKDVIPKFCVVKGIENQARRSLINSELKSVVLDVIVLIYKGGPFGRRERKG